MPALPKDYKVVCRGSLLSRAQAEYFITRVQALHKESKFSIIVKDTAGDIDQQRLLQDMDGRDFFTKDIQDFLVAGHADFAVHSLKDVSSEQFFKNNRFAVISREDPRDVAIFRQDIIDSLARGNNLKLGTSSPRRALMATRFLANALPTVNGKQSLIEPVAIRGNVDTRLRKLHEGQYDGIILAAAGLNRLLSFPPATEIVSQLLRGKKIMVLPLIECPPAPGQGAIVAEALPENNIAAQILETINDPAILDSTRLERTLAADYGAGCHQQFGVVHITTPDISFTYGSGVSSEGQTFEKYHQQPPLVVGDKKIFSAGDHMKSFFRYEYPSQPANLPETPALFVGSQHALQSDEHIARAASYRIWAAGTKTWNQLAKKGIWVEGCADAMGLEFIEPWLSGPLIGLNRNNLTIITDSESSKDWKRTGWNTAATYSVTIERSSALAEQIAAADIIFWTSFRQFTIYRDVVKKDATQCCSTGHTANRFRESGITPVIFAGIKGFNDWRNQTTHTAIKGA